MNFNYPEPSEDNRTVQQDGSSRVPTPSKRRILLEAIVLLVILAAMGRLPEPWRSYAIVALLLYLPLLGKQKIVSWKPVHRRNLKSWALFSVAVLALFLLVLPAWLELKEGRNWAFPGWLFVGSTLLNTTLVAALPEEWFFRGFLMRRWQSDPLPKQPWMLSNANMKVALLFGLVHAVVDLNPFRLIVAFPALWYGAIVECGGGLALAVAAHALSNLCMALVLRGFGY